MSLIKIEGVQSVSAPTKAQKDAAIYMFGSKGHAIVSVLDKFSRAKELRTAHVDGLLKLMKEGDDDEIIKFADSAAGKKSIAAAKQFATAKTLAMSIKSLKLIRVPVKWIEGHSDAAAARITETKEIRARKTASNKPEKPIKLDNPHAPEAVDMGTGVNSSKTTTYTFVKSTAKANGVLALSFLQPGNGYKWTLNISQEGDIISSSHKGTSDYQTSESFFAAGIQACGAKVVNEHQQPNSGTIQLETKAQATSFMRWVKKQKTQVLDFKTGSKLTIHPKSKKDTYTPSGKSDITLVDELAEVTARKISAKPLQAREEYFNALRNVLQNNLPKREVSATSTGVVIGGGSKLYTLRLDNNAWTLQTGVTGKTKKIGATFDIVDVLGMIDKSILSPKPEGSSKERTKVGLPYIMRINRKASTGEYSTLIQVDAGRALDVRFKREGDKFVFSTPVYSDVQKFVTQGMEQTGIVWETFTGKSVTFTKEGADKFEKWVKSIKRNTPLTSNRTFPAIAPVSKSKGDGGMSM